MASVNKVILVGNLGRDPELRYMPSGDAMASFSIATNDSWKDKQGQKQERTEWHRISMFGKVAEIAGEYLKKGASVYLEGRLQTREWKDKDGNDRKTTEVVADRMQMLGGARDPQEHSDVDKRAPARSAPAEKPAAAKPAAAPAPAENFDDDIPF